ncbi:type II toxin-antitoxin system RelE/ParE family toxin [Dyadobacter sp. MSC1_007]|uniref:type II toxin-antitoxin system RelE/ParE family toxin n=1 Tax=Dyadobacter sp. MSC1_007 TaxID=2909264 RepID=UPI00203042C3|nr:type II toxin-antitoxin system RelE/ParE family toxin [Dyadobacter sp. MSC1_007]
MVYEVILAKTAVETFDAIYDQIEQRFGTATAKKFELTVVNTLESISLRPYIFKATRENENVRKGWINKNCSFFYEVTESQIQVLFFWDNRQEPLMDS